VQITTGK